MKNCEKCGELFEESELSNINGVLACDFCNEEIELFEEKERELNGAKEALKDAETDVILWKCMVEKLQKELDSMK